MDILEGLKNARQRRGHSITEAAAAMHISYQQVWRWEHGKQRPTGLYLRAVDQYIHETPGSADQESIPATAPEAVSEP